MFEILRSFDDDEVTKFEDLGRNSVAELLDGGGPGAQTAIGEAGTEKIVAESRVRPPLISSMPVKLPVEVRRWSLSLNNTPIVSPLQRAGNVVITVDDCVENAPDSARPTKSNRSDLWNSSRTATLIERETTDFGLSEIDSVIGRCAAGTVGAIWVVCPYCAH